jgi:hypothetical protein
MKLQQQGGEVALLPPEGKGKPQWGLVHHPHDLSPSSSKRWSRPEKVVPAPFKIGRHVEVSSPIKTLHIQSSSSVLGLCSLVSARLHKNA